MAFEKVVFIRVMEIRWKITNTYIKWARTAKVTSLLPSKVRRAITKDLLMIIALFTSRRNKQ